MSAQPRWYNDIDDDFLGPPLEAVNNTPGHHMAVYKKAIQYIEEREAKAKAEYKQAKERYKCAKKCLKRSREDAKADYDEAMEAYKNNKKEEK